MKIVVLDGYTLNPGDLSWGELKALGECTICDRTQAEDILEYSSDAEIILTNKTLLSGDTIEQLKHLKYIGVLATGYNIVDVQAALKRAIPVTNVPTYGTDSVAQMVFAHILNLTQNVAHHGQTVKDRRWSKNPDFCYWDMPLIELSGLTMGIIGLGRIGRAVAKLALAFGMKVIAYDVNKPNKIPEACNMASLDEVFSRADVLSLHCPLTTETGKIVNTKSLSLMKPTAFLINTSRGPLIDEQSLAEALDKGIIAGAGLDVLDIEPPGKDNPLFEAKNCFITPHIAWATRSARQRLMDTAVENVRAFLSGRSINVVNGVSE